jgi:hypothetical protein
MGSVTYAHDKNGKDVGYYNASNKTTFDSKGKRYGTGNLTNALVFEADRKN